MTFLGILKELGLSSNLDYTRFNDIPYMNQVLQAIEQARRNEPGNFDRIAHGRSASVRVITICSLVHRFLDSQTIFGQTQIQLERDEIVRSNSANSLQLSLNALIFGYDKDIYSLALQQ